MMNEPRVLYRGLPESEALTARIVEHIEALERLYPRAIGCRVAVELESGHHAQGNIYKIRIELKVPGGQLVVGREPGKNRAHEDAYVAVRDAFQAMRRKLEAFARHDRGQARRHSARDSERARTLRVVPEEEFEPLVGDEGLPA